MSGIRKQLEQFKKQADRRLSTLFSVWRDEVPEADRGPSPSDIFSQVEDLTMRGGKRLRPALAYFTALALKPDLDKESLLDASLTIELLQSSLLIHDDIMDRDTIRRGGATVHHALGEISNDQRLGNNLAILSGSLAASYAYKLLYSINLQPETLKSAAQVLTQMHIDVISGQILDLTGGAEPHVIHLWKTTSYTTLGPVRFGATVAASTEPLMEQLADYSIPLGRAFQMRDDYLGIFGDMKLTGKSVGADLKEGKRTDLVQLALEMSNTSQRELIQDILDKKVNSESQIRTACRAIETCGAKASVLDEIQALTSQASLVVSNLPLKGAGQSFLLGLPHLLCERLQ